MVLLGDEAQVETQFCPFGYSANLDAIYVHDLHRTYHRLRKSFWMHPMELLGDWVMWNLIFVHFGDSVAVSTR
jgi:hypothetical protein